MKNFEQSPNKKLDYALLKESILNEAITLKEVQLQLLNADQSTPNHEAANENLLFLEDEQVKDFIYHQSHEIQESYSKFLGFTQWHIAQNLMFEDKDQQGLMLFKKSVENSIKGNSDESWIAYGKGTIAYLENNVEDLRKSILKVTASEKNKIILERMLSRIEKGEEPNYKLDY